MGQEPDGAALGVAAVDHLHRTMRFPEPGGGHQQGRTKAIGEGPIDLGEGVELIREERGHGHQVRARVTSWPWPWYFPPRSA